jgi:hypothetical protein
LHTDRSTVALEDLLVHREWVRRLAMRLTRDEHEADDVEQQTWMSYHQGSSQILGGLSSCPISELVGNCFGTKTLGIKNQTGRTFGTNDMGFRALIQNMMNFGIDTDSD